MKVTTLCDAKVHHGRTPEQLVMFLWKAAFVQNATPYEYMLAVSRRITIDSGKTIRTDTPTHFLSDLEEAGYVTIEWEESE